jgi:hypothetical protein
VVLRKKLVVLLMALVLALMSASPAMAIPAGGFNTDNNGNNFYDGGDANQGGGQEAPKKAKHGIG